MSLRISRKEEQEENNPRKKTQAEAEEFATNEHGKTQKEEEEIATETKHCFQIRMRERRFFLAEANTTFYCISLQA